MKLLFAHGADACAVNDSGQGVFFSAVSSRDPKLLKLVIDETQELRASGRLDIDQAGSGNTALGSASQASHEMVLLLVRAGANAKTKYKNTMSMELSPLMTVALNDCDGEASWVKELIAAGANPLARSRGGQSVMFFAVASPEGLYGKKAVIEALIEAGADPKAPLDCRGMSPFFGALNYQQAMDEEGQPVGPTRSEVIQMVAELGFPSLPSVLPQVSRDEETLLPPPLVLALARQDQDSAKTLIEVGSPLNELDSKGFSVLHKLAVVVGLSQDEGEGLKNVWAHLDAQEQEGEKPC